MPVPNNCSQKRFAATRAVRGLSFPPIQLARANRSLIPEALKMAGTPRATWGPGFNHDPRVNIRVGRVNSLGFSNKTGVVTSGADEMSCCAIL